MLSDGWQGPALAPANSETAAKQGCSAKRSSKAAEKATLIGEKFGKYHASALALAEDWRELTEQQVEVSRAEALNIQANQVDKELDASFALFSTVTSSFLRRVTDGVQRLTDTTTRLEQYEPGNPIRPNTMESRTQIRAL